MHLLLFNGAILAQTYTLAVSEYYTVWYNGVGSKTSKGLGITAQLLHTDSIKHAPLGFDTNLFWHKHVFSMLLRTFILRSVLELQL